MQNQTDGNLFVGMFVAVKGLKEGRHYNGLKGELLEFCPEIHRWYVRVMATPTAVIRIKSENLKIDEKCWGETRLRSKAEYLEWRKVLFDTVMAQRIADDKMGENENLDHTWISIPHVRIIKITFVQLQSLWDKYGVGYTRWFESLTKAEAIAEVCTCKHQFMRSMARAGSPISRQVPAPAGIATDSKCLLPELYTRGPYVEGLSSDEIFEETQAVRNWLSFLKSRTDPASFHNDAVHCQHLYDAGIFIPSEIIKQNPGKRRFCLKSEFNVMEPLNFPDSIYLLPCSEQDSEDHTLSPVEIFTATAGLAVVKWPNAAVYTMALLRILHLASMVFTIISNYRFE
jgi:hypothetical protein